MRIKKEVLKISMLIVIAVLLIIIIFLIRARAPEKGSGTTKQEIVSEPEEYRLYGETVTKAEVDNQYNSLPEELKANLTKEDVAEALATQRLMLKEAERQGITVSDEELESYIQQNLELMSMSREDFQAQLAIIGMTEEEYKEKLKEQVLILKLLNQSIRPEEYSVSDEEIDAFIEENKDTYASMLEQVPELEEVFREQIRTSLMQEKQRVLMEEYLAELKGEG